jgi:hypothetical protein
MDVEEEIAVIAVIAYVWLRKQKLKKKIVGASFCSGPSYTWNVLQNIL